MNKLSQDSFFKIYHDFIDLTDNIKFKNCFLINHHILGYLNNNFESESVKSILLSVAGNKRLVLDTSQDPVDITKNIEPICRSLNLKNDITILVNDYDDIVKYPEYDLRWFPRFFILGRLKSQYQQDNSLINWNSRQHQLSCYNRSAKLHRFYNYYRMGVYQWNHQVHKSFANIEKNLPNEIHDHDALKKPLGPLVYEAFKNIQSHSDDSNYEWSNNCHSFLAPGYNQSYANLITESSVYNFCPTEKTVKPLIAGNIIFSISNPGYMKKIETLGFDLLYDVIDYDRYDNQPDFQARVNKCLAFVDEIFYNLHSIWNSNKTRLQENNRYFWSDAFANRITKQVQDLIEINF